MTQRFCATALENDCFTKSNSYMRKWTGKNSSNNNAAVSHFKTRLVSVLSRIMVKTQNHPHQKSRTHKLHWQRLLQCHQSKCSLVTGSH